MIKPENILAFILSDNAWLKQYSELSAILISATPAFEEYKIVPFIFIFDGNTPWSFILEHSLQALEKKGLISFNGSINIGNSEKLKQIGSKLPLGLQFELRKTVKYVRQGNHEEYVVAAKPSSKKARNNTIYTIGYEGENLDSFLSKLLTEGIEGLVDVRQNAISRKYGFSKRQLSSACKKIGIDYTHIPELGIPSESRQELATQKDYDYLFEEYSNSILPEREKEQKELLTIIDRKPSALMCFEANPLQCHRTTLAKVMAKRFDKKVQGL